MPLYDGIKTSYQLGDDLQVGVIVGAANVAPPLDEPMRSGFFNWSNDGPSISLCEHQGSLFAAFVEADYDGSTTADFGGVGVPYYAARGPYVKRYDPASNSWILVGDPIEPTLTEVYALFGRGANSATRPYSLSSGGSWPGSTDAAAGTRFLPNRVQIASDGTSLYIAYALHVTLPHGGDVYSPLTVVVRKFDGTSWALLGTIDPVGDNDASSIGQAFSCFSWFQLTASPHDAGACYVSLVQCGTDPSGASTYEATVTRFDGGTPTAKTIGTPKTAAAGIDPLVTLTAGTLVYALSLRFDEPTGPWIYWVGTLDDSIRISGQPAESFYVQRWSDMAVTFVDGPYPAGSTPTWVARGYEGDAVLLDVYESSTDSLNLREMPFDGNSIPAPIDGVLPEAHEKAPGGSTALATQGSPAPLFIRDTQRGSNHFHVLPEPPNNIWVVRPLAEETWLYHRPCRAWTQQVWTPRGGTAPIVSDRWFQYDPELDPAKVAVGLDWSRYSASLDTDAVLVEGVIYVAAWLSDTLSSSADYPNADFSLRVYAAPIQRDKSACNAPAARGVYIAPFYVPFGNQPAPV